MISKVLSLKKRIDHHESVRNRCNVFVLLKKRAPLLLYLFWIASGTAFYALHEDYPFHVALYQSTSVGWAIGWSLPLDPAHTDSSIGMLYSCFHNLVGVFFVGVIVLYIEFAVSRTTDHWMVEMTNRHGSTEVIPKTLLGKTKRWLKLHKHRLKIYSICFGCCFLCILFGYYSTDSFNFAESCDMTLSTLSCGGYQGMPLDASRGTFIFLALFTNVAVPLFLVAAGTLASIMMTSMDEKSFYSKIAAPLTPVELKYMQYFGIENGDGVLDKKEFLILVIIRIGNIKPRNVIRIHDHYRQLTAKTGGIMSYASILEGSSDESDYSGNYGKLEQSKVETRRGTQILMPKMRRNFTGFSSRSWSEDVGVDRGEEEAREEEAKTRKKTVWRTINLPKLSFIRRLKPSNSPSKIQPLMVTKTDKTAPEKHFDSTEFAPSHVEAPMPDLIRAFSSSNSYRDVGSSLTVPAGDHLGEDDELPNESEEREQRFSNRKQKESTDTAPNLIPAATGTQSTEELSMASTGGFTNSESNVDAHQLDAKPSQNSRAASNLTGDKARNPFVMMRQFSRQESAEANSERVSDHIVSLSRIPCWNTALQIQQTESTSSCDSNASSSIIITRHLSRSSTSTTASTSYSKSGRKKFSSKKDRQNTYERTLAMFEKSKDRVLGLIAKRRHIRHKDMLQRTSRASHAKITEAHNALEKKLSFDKRLADNDITLCSALWLLTADWLSDSYFQAFIFWLIWLLAGAIFYCYNMDLSFYRGFYMSVNVGYAIYWTQEEDSESTKAFSVLNVIFGQLVTTVAMAFFASKLKEQWYTEAEEKTKLDDVKNEKSNYLYYFMMKIIYVIKRNPVHCLSLLWLLFGVVWSLFAIEWSFNDALYFSITSLSTGGIWSIPEDSSDANYFIVGIFTATGAPILCLSASLLAYLLCRLSHDNDFIEAMNTSIAAEELEMLQVLDIDEDDGNVDITEYVMLILIRIKAVQPELIAAVLTHFNSIEANKGGGGCSYEKILATPRVRKSSISSVLKSRVSRYSQDSCDDN